MATATAMIRSGDRAGRDGGKDATIAARLYRPSCRSHRQRATSARQHVAVQCIEGAAAFFHLVGLRQCRRRSQHFAEAWTRSRWAAALSLLLGHGADLLLQRLGALVAAFQLVGD